MKNGFTLSELLIALTIVGIVAAITVPNVISRYQKDSQILTLKKIYNELGTNMEILKTENIRGDLFSSRLADEDKYKAFFDENYKITTKDCGLNSVCFAETYKNISKETADLELADGYGFMTNGGYSMYVVPADPDEQTPALVYVDVNGNELPNVIGRDFFSFSIYGDYSIDVIAPLARRSEGAKTSREADTCTTSNTGAGCFGKLLNNDFKVDY